MKNLILKYLIVFSLGYIQACSCNDTPTISTEEKTFTLKVFYTKQDNNITYPDTNSRIFIYYDIPSMDWLKYEYLSDGKFMNNDSIIAPIQQEFTNIKGIAQLYPFYSNKPISIVVESHYYKGRQALLTYENYEQSICTEVIFNP